jgi:hypothetical protein
MAAGEKLLERMRRNPQADWRINDFKSVANAWGIPWRARGGQPRDFCASQGCNPQRSGEAAD